MVEAHLQADEYVTTTAATAVEERLTRGNPHSIIAVARANYSHCCGDLGCV